ncbi:hypothetical protein [Pseudoxanthomonas composti]|uniref:Uncharacterized protein n=1 Tax=Pseudoxanthomonas composti TaxID=2137479 RepID=A0A4Q1JXR6_9GAMM|nr:hypothetical protein [Pseudoxanthomonas composti]RXR06102.1 hypothetical protein EPA99_09700 [Pseudoxanthomonas composti]
MLLPVSSQLETDAWRSDPAESEVGIHVVPNFGDDPAVSSPTISNDAIHAALRSVDWINGFHQVVVVTSPGISMEVSGSLDPGHGLSALYRDRHNRSEAVIIDPPETIDEMENILIAFVRQQDTWRQKFEFDFMHY